MTRTLVAAALLLGWAGKVQAQVPFYVVDHKIGGTFVEILVDHTTNFPYRPQLLVSDKPLEFFSDDQWIIVNPQHIIAVAEADQAGYAHKLLATDLRPGQKQLYGLILDPARVDLYPTQVSLFTRNRIVTVDWLTEVLKDGDTAPGDAGEFHIGVQLKSLGAKFSGPSLAHQFLGTKFMAPGQGVNLGEGQFLAHTVDSVHNIDEEGSDGIVLTYSAMESDSTVDWLFQGLDHYFGDIDGAAFGDCKTAGFVEDLQLGHETFAQPDPDFPNLPELAERMTIEIPRVVASSDFKLSVTAVIQVVYK